MDTMNSSPEEMDAWMESQLEVLRVVSYERQPAVVEKSRSKFLREAALARQAFLQNGESLKAHNKPVAKRWFAPGNSLFPNFARAAMAFGIALVVVIGGTAGVVFASQSSLPGDWMYPVKLWGDEVRIDLTTAPEAQLALKLDFAEDRLQEMQQVQILQHTRNQPAEEKAIPAAEQAFTGIYKHLDEALLLAQQLYADDPEMLAQITAQIEQQSLMLEDMNPSVIIKELQELRKDLREQQKELKKTDSEPTAESTSVPQATAVPATARPTDKELTVEDDDSVKTEEDAVEDQVKDKDKEKDKEVKDKETGEDKDKDKDKDKENKSNSSNNNSNNNSNNSSSNNSNNSNKGGKKK